MSNILDKDTIVAQATPPGRGGIGIVRISGDNAVAIAQGLITKAKLPAPRFAQYTKFIDSDNSVIDQGIILFFPAPHSFTGEDVIELQGHGGPWVMDRLLRRILQLGGRLARPGEFSERAFLNNKIDLAQAEAIADLIDSASEQAARSAIRSLQGEFSLQIKQLVERLTYLRVYVEAAIDFAEEEIDFLAEGGVAQQLAELIAQLKMLLSQAKQGAVLREGLSIVLAGLPNAGKSTLLNRLSGEEVAIVTDIPGTTRDVMRQQILVEGIPLHLLDTAGLRQSDDLIEQEGIRRAWQAIEQADGVLLILDATQPKEAAEFKQEFLSKLKTKLPIVEVYNKIDLVNNFVPEDPAESVISLSAKTGEGMALLRQRLVHLAGFEQTTTEASFIARRRHLEALTKAEACLQQGYQLFQQSFAGELLAEDLRQAQHLLGEITGEFTTDDLLGKIFSSFCIGK